MATKKTTTKSSSKPSAKTNSSTKKNLTKTATKKETTKKEITTTAPEPTVKATNKATKTESTKRVKPWMIWLGTLLVLALLLAYINRDQFIVATVNGNPIYRSTIINELESQGGAQVLDQMIAEQLVEQEAVRQGVSIDPAAIDEEIASIETSVSGQGQTLDELLAMQGMTRDDLRQQIRLNMLAEQLQPAPTPPTEEEIQAALEQQADTFPEEMTEDERRQAIVDQLTQQQAGQGVQAWLDSLKEQADIQYLRNY